MMTEGRQGLSMRHCGRYILFSRMKGPVLSLDTPKSSSQNKGDLFSSEGQRERSKRQRHERGYKGEEERVFVLVWTKGMPLDEEETDMVQSQMTVYKAERGNLILVLEVFDFAWTC